MVTSRIDRALLAANWPNLRSADHIKFQKDDVLLVCGGFEDRVMSVLNIASNSNVSDITVLDFEYAPAVEFNHFPEIRELCNKAGWNHIRIEYDRCNPSGIASRVLENLPSDAKRLFVDISGMSRLLIVQLIVGLLELDTTAPSISILYTEAISYPPTESEAHTKLESHANDSAAILSFISAGVYDLAIVPELSSVNINRAPVRLIAFPSFNPTQLLSAKSIVQPAKTTFIHGIPPNADLQWRMEAICTLNQITDEIESQNIKISTLDYSACLKALLLLYDEWAEFYNLVVSPTGSKMQTVAVGIFRSFVSDVQIVYPTPLRFTSPTAHTHGAKQVYVLDLDEFRKLRNSYECSADVDQ